MKAVEFIRKYGWDSAISIVFNRPPSATYYRASDNNILGFGGLYGRTHGEYCGNTISLADLKKFTDAYELVHKFGGLIEAKKCIDDKIYPELGRAITLVEEVGGCDEND